MYLKTVLLVVVHRYARSVRHTKNAQFFWRDFFFGIVNLKHAHTRYTKTLLFVVFGVAACTNIHFLALRISSTPMLGIQRHSIQEIMKGGARRMVYINMQATKGSRGQKRASQGPKGGTLARKLAQVTQLTQLAQRGESRSDRTGAGGTGHAEDDAEQAYYAYQRVSVLALMVGCHIQLQPTGTEAGGPAVGSLPPSWQAHPSGNSPKGRRGFCQGGWGGLSSVAVAGCSGYQGPLGARQE